jgi:type I site-specific restriction endonuclease
MNQEVIAELLLFMREVQKGYKEVVSIENETEKQLQDIAHRLEIYTDSYHETAKLGKLFREVRRTRRKAKEAQEYAEPVIRWIESNKAAMNSLEKLLGTLRHIQEVQGKRAYFPRSHILDYLTDGEQRSMRSDNFQPKAAGKAEKGK